MIETVYVEDRVRSYSTTQKILDRFSSARVISCDHYASIFNRKSQSFRLQKKKPALILAKKDDGFVLETPDYCELGDLHNFYYFSCMLNCIYDCRYCYLQGMYSSAHYVTFVNYEDFQDEIRQTIQNTSGSCYFFSGHVSDSLALDQVIQFSDHFLPFFESLDHAWMELRTKSVQIQSLLEHSPVPNCVVAFSFTPPSVSEEIEHRVPSVEERLRAMKKLVDQGWNIGLRFDPVIYCESFRKKYRRLFEDVFEVVSDGEVHSVTLGPFRLPKQMFKKVVSMYPQEPLFASDMEQREGMVSYREELEQDMLSFCAGEVQKYVPESKFFPSVDLSST